MQGTQKKKKEWRVLKGGSRRRQNWSCTIDIIVLQSGGVSERKTAELGKFTLFLGKQALGGKNQQLAKELDRHASSFNHSWEPI